MDGRLRTGWRMAPRTSWGQGDSITIAGKGRPSKALAFGPSREGPIYRVGMLLGRGEKSSRRIIKDGHWQLPGRTSRRARGDALAVFETAALGQPGRHHRGLGSTSPNPEVALSTQPFVLNLRPVVNPAIARGRNRTLSHASSAGT